MRAERDVAVAERDAIAAAHEHLQVAHDALAARAERLEHLLRTLRRLQFGTRSERLPEAQLQLGLEDIEAAIAKVEAEAERDDPALRRERAAKRRANRGKLPAHLPRIEVALAPQDAACPCCRATMVVIGEDRSERLDIIPAQFRVLVTRRPKLACRTCAGVVVRQPAALQLVEGGIPTEGTVAHMLVALCRPLAALPTGSDLGTPGCGDRPLDAGLMGRQGGGGTRTGDGAAEAHRAGLGADLCRRDRRAGARSRPRAYQEGILPGDRAGRPALGRQ